MWVRCYQCYRSPGIIQKNDPTFQVREGFSISPDVEISSYISSYLVIFHDISWYFQIQRTSDDRRAALFNIVFYLVLLGISTSERRCRACPRPASWTCPTTNSLASGKDFLLGPCINRDTWLENSLHGRIYWGKHSWEKNLWCSMVMFEGPEGNICHWHDLTTFWPVYVQLCESALGWQPKGWCMDDVGQGRNPRIKNLPTSACSLRKANHDLQLSHPNPHPH